VRELLTLYSSFYRRRFNIDDLIHEVGLDSCETSRVAELSGGLSRRVDLALALVGDPMVLFLDEPTTGLDPAARRNTWATISRLRHRGVAILLTSHYLEEVQLLADRVVVLRKGHLVADDAPDRIAALANEGALITFRIEVDHALPSGPWVLLERSGPTVSLTSEDATEALRLLLEWAHVNDVELDDLQVRRPSLEDRYLELTSEK
jgi:ABC-2 type transport system ATP-binding protein